MVRSCQIGLGRNSWWEMSLLQAGSLDLHRLQCPFQLKHLWFCELQDLLHPNHTWSKKKQSQWVPRSAFHPLFAHNLPKKHLAPALPGKPAQGSVLSTQLHVTGGARLTSGTALFQIPFFPVVVLALVLIGWETAPAKWNGEFSVLNVSPWSWICIAKCLGRTGKAGREGELGVAISIARTQGKENMVSNMSQKSPSPAVMCFSQDPEQSRNKRFWIVGPHLSSYLPKQTFPSFSETLTFVLIVFPSGR